MRRDPKNRARWRIADVEVLVAEALRAVETVPRVELMPASATIIERSHVKHARRHIDAFVATMSLHSAALSRHQTERSNGQVLRAHDDPDQGLAIQTP